MISVIVPIYNAEKYLKECFESIASQTYKNIEVILVNDGSTDSSKQICEEYCKRYKNFRLINKENGGQMSAWIMAVKEAKGEFLGFVDSDDYIEPTMFEKMIDKQKEHDSDLVMCSRVLMRQDGTEIVQSFSKTLKSYYPPEEKNSVLPLFLPTLLGNLSQARWDKLFKKNIYIKCMERYCTYHSRTLEDRFIVVPYVFYSNSFSFIDEPLYRCRILENSSSKKYRPELPVIIDKLYEERKKLINDLDVNEEYQELIEIEKIDFIRIMFSRMICVKLPRKILRKNAKIILSEENRKIVVKHKRDCVGRFGKFIYFCSKYNTPRLLIIAGKLFNVSF